MRFKTIKEVPETEEGWEDFETIPKGTICEVKDWHRAPTIFYKGKAVCDVDSQMCKDYFEEVADVGVTIGLVAIIPKDKKKLEQGIAAIEWQLKQPDEDEKSREIHESTLKQYKDALLSVGNE